MRGRWTAFPTSSLKVLLHLGCGLRTIPLMMNLSSQVQRSPPSLRTQRAYQARSRNNTVLTLRLLFASALRTLALALATTRRAGLRTRVPNHRPTLNSPTQAAGLASFESGCGGRCRGLRIEGTNGTGVWFGAGTRASLSSADASVDEVAIAARWWDESNRMR